MKYFEQLKILDGGRVYGGIQFLDNIPSEKRKLYQDMERFVEIIFNMERLKYSDIDYSLDILHMNEDMRLLSKVK